MLEINNITQIKSLITLEEMYISLTAFQSRVVNYYHITFKKYRLVAVFIKSLLFC